MLYIKLPENLEEERDKGEIEEYDREIDNNEDEEEEVVILYISNPNIQRKK